MDKLFSKFKSKNDLLDKQQITQEKINELLNLSTEALMCGPDCQKQKISDELKQKYLDAENNMETAPIKLEETKKNYYVYTEGRPYYDNMREEELKQKSIKITELLSDAFNEELTNAKTMNSYLNTALINSNYTDDLLNEYLKKNEKLIADLKDSRGIILTNDRKTYYETNAIDRLKLWYKLFWYIYYFLWIIISVALFMSPNELTIVKKLALIIGLLVYPYIINYIINWFYNLWYMISLRMPKNVYNNL